MSQLYDRLIAEGCRPWSFADWPARPPDPSGKVPPADQMPRAAESLDTKLAEGAFVVDGAAAVRYLDSFRDEVSSFDIIVNVAPPHQKMFFEFPAVGIYKERHGLHSWGILLESVDFEAQGMDMEGARWGFTAYVIFEPRKGYVCGPVARTTFFALPDGTLERHPDRKVIGGHTWVKTSPSWFSDAPGDNFTEEMEQALWELLVPMLFSISLMHTRNVTVEPTEPNPTVSGRFERRHGRPLVRYHTLIIDPMREVLEREGKASSEGLAHAVHTCRGHFKRYGEDSPLFGRYTGTWWWTEHRRGRPELGEIKHDYRVQLPGFGSTYRRADEHPDLARSGENRGSDPDAAGRGLAAHNATQNAFADALELAGYTPQSPKAEEPDYDVGWQDKTEGGSIVWVGEVKSLTPTNEERQMRTALGQVLRYRQSLISAGHQVRAAVITEHEPSDPTWAALLDENDVALVFPGSFDTFISALSESA
jgi:hypothetical protein